MFEELTEAEIVDKEDLFKLGLRKEADGYVLINSDGELIEPTRSDYAKELLETYQSFPLKLRKAVNYLTSSALRGLLVNSMGNPGVMEAARKRTEENLEKRVKGLDRHGNSIKSVDSRLNYLRELNEQLNELQPEIQGMLDQGENPEDTLSLVGQSLGIYDILQKYYGGPISQPLNGPPTI